MSNKNTRFELLKNEHRNNEVKEIYKGIEGLVNRNEISDLIIVYVVDGYINTTRSHMYDTQLIGYLEASKASILDDMKE